jgi:hypothetical protein
MNDFHIVKNTKSVKAISNYRIPFEPKGIEKEFKNSLRNELSKLKLSNNEMLFATFKNSNNNFFDVENILFYNIGASAFRGISANGIMVEYPEETFQSMQGSNQYEYTLINKDDYCSYFIDETACKFEFEVDNINTNTKAHNYWYAFHNGKVDIHSNVNINSDYFGIDIQIYTPQPFYNLSSLIKPMLDGIISALHYELNFDETGIERLAYKLSQKTINILDLFKKKPYSILGSRNILQSYRSGVKWNPQDERCRKIRVIPVINSDNSKVIIKGKINWLS